MHKLDIFLCFSPLVNLNWKYFVYFDLTGHFSKFSLMKIVNFVFFRKRKRPLNLKKANRKPNRSRSEKLRSKNPSRVFLPKRRNDQFKAPRLLKSCRIRILLLLYRIKCLIYKKLSYLIYLQINYWKRII